MNATTLKRIACCASLSMLTLPFGAVNAQDNSLASALSTPSLTIPKNQQPVEISNSLRLQLGKNLKKYRAAPRDKAIENRYIVVYKDKSIETMAAAMAGTASFDQISDELATELKAQAVNELTQSMALDAGVSVTKTYGHAVGGFAAKMTEKSLASVTNDPRVDFVEQDQIMSTIAVQNNATWGLDRIDEADLPLDGFYEFNFDGSGVDAYIIDTGILASHRDFGGRVDTGFTAINDGRGSNDCNGHGTHVAGTVGSQTYGVAKNANLVAVRVLGCTGSGSNSGVIDGVNYVARVASGPSVANMSLGGGNSAALDRAVESAIGRGVTFVVAAGNSNANACSGSPNRVPAALTVGATTRSDVRSSFSNFGSCVDIFAPGSSITSTWSTGNTATNTISGTSMASPHVAGVVALYLDQQPSASPAQVERAVEGAAARGKLRSIGTGSPNLLAQSLLGGGGGGGGGGGNPTPTCAFDDDFSSSTGWQITPNSTCSTGTYVRGNPTRVTNGGVVTQVGGDAGGDGFSIFTANNSAAGTDDVDGGECGAQSPSVSVSRASTLSLDWFHGQRDGGDDAGDYFRVEYSLNGGSSFRNLVAIGDTQTQAQWRNATASIPAGSNVVVRVRASDGTGDGDLIEAGLDSVKICSN